jgi:hypothetical protein
MFMPGVAAAHTSEARPWPIAAVANLAARHAPASAMDAICVRTKARYSTPRALQDGALLHVRHRRESETTTTTCKAVAAFMRIPATQTLTFMTVWLPERGALVVRTFLAPLPLLPLQRG